MFFSKNMDAANAVEAAYNKYQRPCTPEEADLMTFKSLTCLDGQSGRAAAGHCYNICFNKSYTSPGFDLIKLLGAYLGA